MIAIIPSGLSDPKNWHYYIVCHSKYVVAVSNRQSSVGPENAVHFNSACSKLTFLIWNSPPPHLHSFCCCQHFNHTSKPPNDFGSWRNARTPQLKHLRWLVIEFIIADLAGHSSVGAYFQWQCPGLQCRWWLWWKCLRQYLWTLISKKTLSPRELASHRLPAAFKFGQKSLWTVLFWQLNVAKLLSSFLGLFPWGGRDRKSRYFYENGCSWELTLFFIYI